MGKKPKKVPRYLRGPKGKIAGDTAECPACNVQRDVAPIHEVEARLPGIPRVPSWAVSLAKTKRLAWGCEECLASGRALPADPTKQVYCCDVPYFAYRNMSVRCRDCGDDFVFGAAEQLFWYEELRFVL